MNLACLHTVVLKVYQELHASCFLGTLSNGGSMMVITRTLIKPLFVLKFKLHTINHDTDSLLHCTLTHKMASHTAYYVPCTHIYMDIM